MSEIAAKFIEKHLDEIEKNLEKLKKIHDEIEFSKNILKYTLEDIRYPANLRDFLKSVYEKDNEMEDFLYGYMFNDIAPTIYLCDDDDDGENYYVFSQYAIDKYNPPIIEEEKVDFENFQIQNIDFEKNTVWIIAGGDWQGSFMFSATLKNMKGRWEYNNDLKKVDEDDYECFENETIIKMFSHEE